jgi:hypothetical protein
MVSEVAAVLRYRLRSTEQPLIDMSLESCAVFINTLYWLRDQKIELERQTNFLVAILDNMVLLTVEAHELTLEIM